MATKELERAILQQLVPDLELELLEVRAVEWSELGPEDKKRGERAAQRLLETTIEKILDSDRAAKQEQQKRQEKNLNVYRCSRCKNSDPALFVEVEGSVICKGLDDKGCGLEVQFRKPHEGNFYRSFEGEADRSHHGKPYNPLFSEAWNSRTTSNIEGIGVKAAAKLKAAMNKVEDDLSNTHRDIDDRRTRDAYKDKHKNKAFDAMRDVASNLSLHAHVVERAQWLFAKFREDRDKVQKDQLVIASCLVASLRESVVWFKEEEGGGALSALDEEAAAERERTFRLERQRLEQDIERRNAERKRARELQVAELEKDPGAWAPMAQWDASRVREWARGVLSAEPEGVLDRFIESLLRGAKPGKTPGQCLVLCNPAKLAGCCQGNSEMAERLFTALKEAKERDKEFSEAARKVKPAKRRST